MCFECNNNKGLLGTGVANESRQHAYITSTWPHLRRDVGLEEEEY